MPTSPESARGRACLLGVDVGSTNLKVAAVSPEGELIRLRRSPTPHSASQLIDVVLDGLRSVSDGCEALAIGIASMAETGVPLRGSEPLGDLVRWNRVGADEAPDDLARLDAAELHAATGVPLTRKTPLRTWARLRVADSDRWAAMTRWSGVADLVALALTGELATDHTLAGRTMAYRLPRRRELPGAFDEELLALVGMRPAQLPRVVAPGESAGVTLPGLGLPAGLPVYISGHDHAVGAWGAGMRAPGDRVDSVGTSEAVLRIASHPVERGIAGAQGMSVTRSVDGLREVLLAGSPGGGSFVASLLRGDLGGRALEPSVLEAAAPHPSFFALPYPLGRQSPSPDPEARTRFVDRNGREVNPTAATPEELAGAVLLGLCLQLRWMLDAQDDVLGEPTPVPLPLIGGPAAASGAWRRMRAAVVPARFARVASDEPVAVSAALLAGVRAGASDSSVTLPVGPAEGQDSPDPGIAEIYAAFLDAAAAAPPKGQQ